MALRNSDSGKTLFKFYILLNKNFFLLKFYFCEGLNTGHLSDRLKFSAEQNEICQFCQTVWQFLCRVPQVYVYNCLGSK